MFDLEGSVRLPHSDEQDPFRALWFLVPSRLEGMWGIVDGKADGLADARHLYEQYQVNYSVGIDSIGYYSLHRSIMGCSLRVTRAGVAG